MLELTIKYKRIPVAYAAVRSKVVILMLFTHCLLLARLVWCLMLAPCFVVCFGVHFSYISNHLAEEERAGCCT